MLKPPWKFLMKLETNDSGTTKNINIFGRQREILGNVKQTILTFIFL